MTAFEIAVGLGSIATAGAGMAYVGYLVKTSGRDRPDDPARVQRFLDTAPYERLDSVLSKQR